MTVYTEQELNTKENEILFNRFIEKYNNENISSYLDNMIKVLERWSETKSIFTQTGISKVEQLVRYSNVVKKNEFDDNYISYILEYASKCFGKSRPGSSDYLMVYKNKDNNKYNIRDGKEIKTDFSVEEAAESEIFGKVIKVYNQIFSLASISSEEIYTALINIEESSEYKTYIAKQFLRKAIVLEFCQYDKIKNPRLEMEFKYPLIFFYNDDWIDRLKSLFDITESDYFAASHAIAMKYLAIINYFGKKQDDKWVDLKPTPLVVDVMSIALWSKSKDFSNTDSNTKNETDIKYWIYNLEQNALNWDELFNSNIIGIDCNSIGNLREYSSCNDIKNALKESQDINQKIISEDLWDFVENLKPGDVVYAQNGTGHLKPGDVVYAQNKTGHFVGKGIVESEYFFDDSIKPKHYRKIKWIKKGNMKNLVSTESRILNPIEQDDAVKMEEFIFNNTFSEMLYDSKNLILHGAPGTGKSYLAKEIAADIITNGELIDGKPIKYNELKEQKEQVAFVQFHPNYDYSDFVEGLRPRINEDGTMGFELKDGVFKSFIMRARADYEDYELNRTKLKRYVFIIDEINRGEISKILGELFYCIDPGYRGRDGEIFTQYANLHTDPDEKFYIPENVYIIGTMNDIDRSVDSFDFAMRRRFRFVELEASKQLNMLDSLGELKDEAVRRMTALNNEILKIKELNSNYQIGAAYFLKLNNLSSEKLWTDYLEPLLQEYVRGMYKESEIMDQLEKAYKNAYNNKTSTEGETDESCQN